MRLVLRITGRVITFCWAAQYLTWGAEMVAWRFDWWTWPIISGEWMALAVMMAGVSGMERCFRSLDQS